MTEHSYTNDEVIKAIDSIKANDGESLKEICDFMSEHTSESYEMCIRIERVEAVKEFAEKLKEELTTGAAVMRKSTLGIIDDLVKEFTEEKQ